MSECIDSCMMVTEHLASEDIIREYALYSLKGLHDYSNVQYIRWEKGCYCMCYLCQSYDDGYTPRNEIDTIAALEKHVHSLRHGIRYFQLATAQTLYMRQARVRRLETCEAVMNRIGQLKSEQAKSHLNNLAFQYIDSPLGEKNKPPMDEETRRWNALKDELAKQEAAEK